MSLLNALARRLHHHRIVNSCSLVARRSFTTDSYDLDMHEIVIRGTLDAISNRPYEAVNASWKVFTRDDSNKEGIMHWLQTKNGCCAWDDPAISDPNLVEISISKFQPGCDHSNGGDLPGIRRHEVIYDFKNSRVSPTSYILGPVARDTITKWELSGKCPDDHQWLILAKSDWSENAVVFDINENNQGREFRLLRLTVELHSNRVPFLHYYLRDVEFYGDLYGKVADETHVSDQPEDAHVIHETLKRIDGKCRNVIVMPQIDECLGHQQLSSVIVGDKRVIAVEAVGAEHYECAKQQILQFMDEVETVHKFFFHDMVLHKDMDRLTQQEYGWIGFSNDDYYTSLDLGRFVENASKKINEKFKGTWKLVVTVVTPIHHELIPFSSNLFGAIWVPADSYRKISVFIFRTN